jgi:DNA repair ATPase RecN
MHPTEPGSMTSKQEPRTFVWSGEQLSTIEQVKARINAQFKATTAEEKATTWENEYSKLYSQFCQHNEKYNQLLGVSNDQKARIGNVEKKRDEALRDMHNSQIERDEWHSKYEHQLALNEDLRQQMEKRQEEQSRASEKYNDTLKTNLQLSQKLTSANEDYLVVARKLEETEEKLTTARTNAKKTLKLHV